ncbi:MAG: serine hydrolase domain-containing protein [Pseudomonadales bacterium]
MAKDLQQLLDDAATDPGVVGGVAAAFDASDTLSLQAFGQQRIDDDAPMQADTVFAIMSMTKPLTGAAAMQLVERGQLSLDTDAGEVCSHLGEAQVLEGFTAEGEPLLRKPSGRITLRQLLTHTSGFVYDTWNADMLQYMAHTETPDIATLKRAALNVPILFDPGNRWEYGIGIDWVGQMVETVSGQTLGEYLAEHLTGPLGMADTAFAATESMATRRVPIHLRKSDASLKPLPIGDVAEPEFEMGGGGLLSTAADFGRFIRMMLRGGELDGQRVLQQDTVVQMGKNQIGDLRVKPLKSVLPKLSGDAEFFPGEPKTWGLSFQISESACATGRAAGTLMWAGLANTYFWIDPVAQLGGVFLSQVFPFVDPKILNHYYNYEAAVYAAYAKEPM